MSNVRIGVSESFQKWESIRRFIGEAVQWDTILRDLNAPSPTPRLVVVKPNWIQESHEYRNDVWEPVITSPELILCLLDFLAERIIVNATVCVCDSPHTYADFDAIIERGDFRNRFARLAEKHPQITFELLDLRREVWSRKEEVIVERRPNTEDPRGYVEVNLGQDSLLYGHPGDGRFYGADYDSKVVNRHHQGKVQEYLIAGTPIVCDLFINVPKMKTHKKTGITCCLKNLVGINGDKNWLPHHTEGSPASRGDEFPYFSCKRWIESLIKHFGMKIVLTVPVLGTWIYRKMRNAGKQVLGDSETVVRNGNWSGNDTCWRMALDLNRALLYVNPDGTWRERFNPKSYLAIVDGVVAGQGNGPLCPDPVPANVLVAGTNFAEIDAVVAKLAGFDPARIPLIRHAFDPHRWPITDVKMEDVRVFDERVGREIGLNEVAPVVEGGFVPHFGWNGIRDLGVK